MRQGFAKRRLAVGIILTVVAVPAVAFAGINVTGVLNTAIPRDEPSSPTGSADLPRSPTTEAAGLPMLDDGDLGLAAAGLHYTPMEVEIWRDRAQSGPFAIYTGAPQHYPGDWERIRENAVTFLANPMQARWSGPEHNNPGGCVQVDPDYPSSSPPGGATVRLRDAAFYYLVTQHPGYRDAVKTELLWFAQQPGIDFSDRDRWCTGILGDQPPSWDTAIWLSQLLYAYDYLGVSSFTAAEQAALNQWFYDAADYWQHDSNVSHDSRFVDRWSGDHTLTNNSCSSTSIAYYGSKPVCTLAMFYNNRKAQVFRFVTSAGIKLEHEEFIPPAHSSPGMTVPDLQRSGALFAHEWLMFSVYPEGFFGEFERWTDDNPILGWAYGAGVLSPIVTIADELARAGDRSVVDFTTRDGALGTASPGGRDWGTGEALAGSGPDKSLEFAIEAYAGYVDGSYVRYGTDNPDNLTDDYRIRSYHGASEYYSNVDAGVMMVNNYYRSNYIREMYLRTGPAMPSYPTEPADAGLHGWMANGRAYPGVLFMFGDLEGQVWPYGPEPPLD